MTDVLDEEFGLPLHPEADKLIVHDSEIGQCICGADIPAMINWKGGGSPWACWDCAECGRGYVEEDEFIAIYDDGCSDD